jgi:hypothetical protein
MAVIHAMDEAGGSAWSAGAFRKIGGMSVAVPAMPFDGLLEDAPSEHASAVACAGRGPWVIVVRAFGAEQPNNDPSRITWTGAMPENGAWRAGSRSNNLGGIS